MSKAYALLVKSGYMLQSPLLLVMRLWWGRSFFLTGKGKLMNRAGTTDFFQMLGIPVPGLTGRAAASVECFGGLFSLADFASLLTAIPLSITMFVAYFNAESVALKSILSDNDKFTLATPFLFLLTALLVLAFGPGEFLIGRMLAPKFSPVPLNTKG
ncbi:MAG: DoxX family protein [Chthoniobacteraceae bacterium]